MAIIGVGVTMPARPAPHPSIVVSRDIANGWMPIMTALPVSRIAGDNREPIGVIEHAKPEFLSVVGETGFEPATSCSQSRRATGLRYSPTTGPRLRQRERASLSRPDRRQRKRRPSRRKTAHFRFSQRPEGL